MWRERMRRLVQPVSRAASTNSFSRMDSTSPWITRVIGVQ